MLEKYYLVVDLYNGKSKIYNNWEETSEAVGNKQSVIQRRFNTKDQVKSVLDKNILGTTIFDRENDKEEDYAKILTNQIKESFDHLSNDSAIIFTASELEPKTQTVAFAWDAYMPGKREATKSCIKSCSNEKNEYYYEGQAIQDAVNWATENMLKKVKIYINSEMLFKWYYTVTENKTNADVENFKKFLLNNRDKIDFEFYKLPDQRSKASNRVNYNEELYRKLKEELEEKTGEKINNHSPLFPIEF